MKSELFSLVSFLIGTLLLIILNLYDLNTNAIPPGPVEHIHIDHPRSIGNGTTTGNVTTCGDTSVVFNSGRHVPIPERHMKLIVDKPE